MMKNILDHRLETGMLTGNIDQITARIDVERIYVHEIESVGTSETILTILIAKTCERSQSELYELVSPLFDQQQKIHVTLHQADWISEAVSNGNLYFCSICTRDKMIYSKEGSDFQLLPALLSQQQMLENARHQYGLEENKIKAFVDGADFHLEKQNYSQSAFMIHQAIELTYRAVELLITGRSKITHSIKAHQNYLEPYQTRLSNIFSPDCESDMELLRLLDQAYLSVRYENSYQISRLDVTALRSKVSEVKLAADETCVQILKNFQPLQAVNVLSETIKQTDHSNAGPDIPLSLIEQICGTLDVERIYCFGKRTYQDSRYHPLDSSQNGHLTREHFDLLIITADQPARREVSLQNIINNKSGNQYSVLLLAVSLETLTRLLDANNRFFHHAMARAEVLHQKNERFFAGPVPVYDESRTLLDCKIHWNQRHSRADAFIAATEPAWEAGEQTVVVSLISQGVEQICLGLIFVFLGYQPDRHTLSHLFDLCSNFTPLLDDLFPRKTQLDQDVFKVLSDGARNVRYLARFSPDPTETGVLHQRLELLIKQSSELVQQHFDQIKV
ncbi:HEPN domain-containing protein [Dyadobacter sp. LHD-138]|uniref:HEPN domain-containing protein n=1 Tax=Dyadobacter sp. LHD-138 TaxID=3071413 RepID=UPI0027E10F3D|nr:HEPN domain-containing protein [Dyadobacter sp. LHD-138]MDQ6482606.1 HEPN domain-containing protein [Dyadobacter sp. LHD-138]